jgi:hypothetical protein
MSTWLHVFLTIYRYLCVAFNNKLKNIFNNRKRLSLMFVGLFVVMCIVNLPSIFFRLNSNDECVATNLIVLMRNIFILLFRTFLPILFQKVFSALLIYKLFKVSRSVNRNQLTEKEYKSAKKIVWLVAIYLITETPYLLMTIYKRCIRHKRCIRAFAYQTLAYYCSLIFGSHLFGSLLFFVNLFTNKLFQREIKTMFYIKK